MWCQHINTRVWCQSFCAYLTSQARFICVLNSLHSCPIRENLLLILITWSSVDIAQKLLYQIQMVIGITRYPMGMNFWKVIIFNRAAKSTLHKRIDANWQNLSRQGERLKEGTPSFFSTVQRKNGSQHDLIIARWILPMEHLPGSQHPWWWSQGRKQLDIHRYLSYTA